MPNLIPAHTINEAQQVWRDIICTGYHPYPLGNGTCSPEPLTSPAVCLNGELALIRDINIADRQVTAGCGTTIATLENELTTAGLSFPARVFDPAKATLGGWLGVGMPGSGGRILPARRLLAATLLTPQGRLIHSGAATPKDVAGYDFHRPLVGAFGSLGMLLEVTLAVDARPANNQLLHLIPIDSAQMFKQLERCRTVERLWAETRNDAIELLIEQNGSAEAMANDLEQLSSGARVCDMLCGSAQGIWNKVLANAFARQGYYLRWALTVGQACTELAQGGWWGNPWEGRIWRYLGIDKPPGDLSNGHIVFERKGEKLVLCTVPHLGQSDSFMANV